MFVVADCVNSLFNIANNELQLIGDWFASNKLTVNYSKTNYMIFVPKNKTNNQLLKNSTCKVNFGNVVLERVCCVKYLGIIIDEKLSLRSEHINSLTKKISDLTGIIFRQRMHLPNYCKKNIYYSLVYSHIVYGILLYGNSSKSALNPLVIRVNSLLRALQGKRRSYPVAHLYQEYNTLPVFELYTFYVAKLMHSCMYDHLIMPTVMCRRLSVTYLPKKLPFILIALASGATVIIFLPKLTDIL